MTCTHCGANLYEECKELCWTLTSQSLSFDPDPDDPCVNYGDVKVWYDETKECTLHCAECGEDVTPEQDQTLRRLMH
jgi:hypothetical protein